MKVGKAKLFKARKDTDGDAGCFHRGQGGRRARKVKRTRKSIETKLRQDSRKLCRP